MKLELKNVKFYESMSEETNCFQADLFIDGKKVAYVKNVGRGGSTDYNAYPSNDNSLRDKLAEAEAYLAKQPEKDYWGEGLAFQPTMEMEIDDLFDKWLTAKDQAKFEKKRTKDCEKGIVYGDDKQYSVASWSKLPLKSVLLSAKGRELVKNFIETKRKEGHTIFNTNIPQEYLN